MPTRRAILSALALGACVPPQRPAAVPLGAEGLIVAAESWHTDLCIPADAVQRSALAPATLAAPGAAAFAFGYGLESWMRAVEPGSGEAWGAVFGGPAAISVRALAGPVPSGAEDQLLLHLPPGGIAAIAAFVTRQLAAPLPAAAPSGAWTLVPSRIPYTLGFTCNTWVMQALAEAGLPVPVAGILRRESAMEALRAEARRQAVTHSRSDTASRPARRPDCAARLPQPGPSPPRPACRPVAAG